MSQTIRTPWGETLNRDQPLPEYPRPQFQRESFYNLNGVWDYAITQTQGVPSRYQGEIVVPFSPESILSGVERTLKKDEYLYYSREFTLPPSFLKDRTVLHFDAVDQEAKVFLNGVFLGDHEGGYLPFSFDVSAAIQQENHLVVEVKDCTDASYFSRGKQSSRRGGIWYTPQSGIWQTVWLESLPSSHLTGLKITPDFDRSAVRIEWEQSGSEICRVSVFDGEQLAAEGADCKGVTLPLPGFKSWSPESPFLYTVTLQCGQDQVSSYFGMRKFSIGKDAQGVPRLFLNNRPYFQNGVLDQGYWCDGMLTPPSDEAMVYDIQTAKSMGFNMLRKHIKIEPMRWYYHCDRLGMIVWQDMVNGGGHYPLPTISVLPFIGMKMDDHHYRLFGRQSEAGRQMYEKELEQTVSLLYNTPCIGLWVPFNEGWGQFDSLRITEKIRQMDSTRLVDHASGWHDQGGGDVDSRHIYFTPIKVKMGRRPYALTEFGGFSSQVKGHTFSNRLFGYKIFKDLPSLQAAVAKLFKTVLIPQIPKGLSAAVYTQLTDVEDELNGLMTYDRKVVKFDPGKMKKINEKMKL